MAARRGGGRTTPVPEYIAESFGDDDKDSASPAGVGSAPEYLAYLLLAGATGLEPAASSVTGRCAIYDGLGNRCLQVRGRRNPPLPRRMPTDPTRVAEWIRHFVFNFLSPHFLWGRRESCFLQETLLRSALQFGGKKPGAIAGGIIVPKRDLPGDWRWRERERLQGSRAPPQAISRWASG
jgi:hypothetical protein